VRFFVERQNVSHTKIPYFDPYKSIEKLWVYYYTYFKDLFLNTMARLISMARNEKHLRAFLPSKITGMFTSEIENKDCFPFVQRSLSSSTRRKRPAFEKYHLSGNSPTFGRLEGPYEHGEESMDEYLRKTSLSPWVPLPDAAVGKIFDLTAATPRDIHVDLGSGDGRVNFYAINFGVLQSTGIDIDEKIVQIARDRLAKRHPRPKLEFIVADLMDEDHPAWAVVQQATIISMYFADEALAKFRPLLEKKLAGLECKIVTCGYEMPGWISAVEEVVLGMPLNLYNWGNMIDDDDDGDMSFVIDDVIQKKPKELTKDPLANEKFAGSTVIDHTRKFPLRGFDPKILDEHHHWDSDEEEEESDIVNDQKPENKE
jgi:hypothetical protein